MICHDQESLSKHDFEPYVNLIPRLWQQDSVIPRCVTKHIAEKMSVHSSDLLLHSEKNSQDLSWFESHGSIGVYWWCHAVIARDWYRYAEHDPNLKSKKTPKNNFLIYNRAWSGLREYRLKFSELLVKEDLVTHCQTTFSTEDNTQHYTQHKFTNHNLQIQANDLEKYFLPCQADAAASADYTNNDYNNAWIEVVLETVFDDTKLHLTEKALRPIACRQPFILAATPGSLEYLRSYGFRTFGDCWDESYDTIADPLTRLTAIVALMKKLSQLPLVEKLQLTDQLAQICEHNHLRFFSADFHNQVIDEFCTNVAAGVEKITKEKSYDYCQLRMPWFKNSKEFIGCEDLIQQMETWFKHNS